MSSFVLFLDYLSLDISGMADYRPIYGPVQFRPFSFPLYLSVISGS